MSIFADIVRWREAGEKGLVQFPMPSGVTWRCLSFRRSCTHVSANAVKAEAGLESTIKHLTSVRPHAARLRKMLAENFPT
jgi:hypothetical protein